MKVAAIINVDASAVSSQGVEAFRSALVSEFAQHGVEAELGFVEGGQVRDSAERVLAGLSQKRIEAVVVGGGDGTIRAVAAVLAGTEIPMGVLPIGSLNHFAKDLNIPTSLADAIGVIASGHSRLVDVGEVNGEVFINNSSIGVYPFIVLDRTRRSRREGRPKWVAMLLATIRILRKWPVRSLRITAQGRTSPYRTPCLFVGNNAYDLRAMGKRGVLDAGELWVSIAKRQSRLAFAWLVLASLLGLVDQADLQTLTVRSAKVGSRRHHLLVALDGEVQRMRPPLCYRSRPRALRVLAPRPMPPV